MYLPPLFCLLCPLLLHAAPEPSTRDDTARSKTMSQQQQWKEPDVPGSFHNGTDSVGLVASVTPQRLRKVDKGGTAPTEGGTALTEGGTALTEGGTVVTEGGTALTEGGTALTEGGGMAREGGDATESGATATKGGATVTEGGGMATEGDYEGDDVFVEAPDEDYAVLFPRDDGDDDEAVERIFEAAVDDGNDVFTLPNLLDDLVRAEMSELMPSDEDYDEDGAPDDIDSMMDNSIVHRRSGSLYLDYQDLGATSSYAAPMGVLINEARREMEESRGLRDELGGGLVDVLPEEVGLETERGDLQRLVSSLSVVNGDAESQPH